MTTTAATVIAVSGSPVLELLDQLATDDTDVRAIALYYEQPGMAYKLRCLSGLGLAAQIGENGPYRLTADGRDLLDRCTR
jgi:hypothetical protein